MQAYRLETAAETGDQWTGIIYHFEDWLRPHLDSGALEPVLESWWQSFSGRSLTTSRARLCRPRCERS